MAAIRVPFLTKDCRMSLLHSSFLLFQFFLNKSLDGTFKGSNITVQHRKGCKGITFFDTSYLKRVMHLIFAIYDEMVNGGHKLRLACFGSHINENIIGRIRVSCHGNPTFAVIRRVLAKAEVRRVLQSEIGTEHRVRGRDNVGGTKLDAHDQSQLPGCDFAERTRGIITALEDRSLDDSAKAFTQICSFLRAVNERNREIYQVYPANSAANSGIMARLIKFVSNKESNKLPECECPGS